MKKLFASLLTLSLLLSLTACGGNGDPTGPDAPKPSQPETPELTFAVGTPLTHESTYTADDGTVLLHTNYELPQLELRTADGALYEPGAAATQSAAVAVRDAFNAEMERCYAAVLSNESELAQEARDHYGSDSMSFEYIYYEDELLGEVVYQTDGLISVLANAYAFYGGAHPNTSTLTWSFDLTTGEFLTLDALNAQSSTDSALGKTLVDTLASEIVNRIYEEGLDDYLYDDFYSYVYDLSSNAHFYFSGSGMTVNFDAYVLGPYASGPQTFEIPYSHFYNALDSHTQSLLNVPQHEMEKVLFAADELTGLIGAVALMRPSKSVDDLEVKSVKKKYKDKKFAAGCSREVIERGAEMLGWDLDTLIERTILAMRASEHVD